MKKIAAPIDNKNLMEDPFEDEVFGDFDVACDHRVKGVRHLIGRKTIIEDGIECESGLVDVRWKWGDNCVTITLLAVPKTEDWEDTRRHIFDAYKQEFKAWECEDNPGLVVEFYELSDKLNVIFYFNCEDEPDESDDDPAQNVYAAYSENMRNAVAYINDQLEPEDKAIIGARVDKNFRQHMNPSYAIDGGKIIDLLEEYGNDHDLGEGWWESECELDDIVLLIQFEN